MATAAALALLATTSFQDAFAQTAAGQPSATPSKDSPQLAQQGPAQGDSSSGTAIQEIFVTGSLIHRTDSETASPVTVLSSDALQKSGLTTMADALRSIAADNSGTIPTAFSNGFAAGSSAVALRALTANSTLVLIDGLRTASYPLPDDGARGFVDLNTIAFSNVERVEVLKDGASSIYGADAVGGVVNIITRKTFQGVDANAELGDTEHGGGFSQRYTLTAGHGDLSSDGYNAYLNFEYQGDARISVGDRSFPFNTSDLSSIGGLNNIGGQPGLFNGSIYGSVAPATLANGNVLSASPVGPTQPLRPCGPPTAAAVDGSGNGYCAQDFLKYTDVQPAETRGGILGRFTAQLTPGTQTSLTLSYYQNRTVVDEPPAQLQSSTPINTNSLALPATLSNGQLNPNDPFASLGEAAQINYAFGDIPSQIILNNRVYRAVADISGSGLGWNYQASLNFNHASLQTQGLGFIYEPQLISDVQSGAYNFINPAANSPAVRAALAPELSKTSGSDLDSLDLNATRQLLDLPGGPLGLALGGQVRYEAVSNPNINTNDEVAAGDGTIQPAYTFGHRTVGGIFGELEAPVVKPLSLNVSGRYDYYSDVGGSFSPKVGVKFTPVRELALRGTYSQGFSAPSFSQSGNSGVIGYTPYIAAGSAPASFVAAHNDDAYVTSPYNLNGSTHGNPNIKPETSNSFTLGFVIEPDSRLNLSVDYYNIRQNNVIGGPNQGNILADYYGGVPLPAGVSIVPDVADPQAPNALARPIVINESYINSASQKTDGLDIDLRGKLTLPLGIQWTSDLNFTDIFRFEYTNGGVTYEYVGTQAPYGLSSGAGTPQYRGNWANSFTLGPVNITGTLYFISSIKETGVDITGSSTACLYTTAAGAPFPDGCNVGQFWDFDLTGRYRISTGFEVYAYVANLFDRKPPLDPADYAAGANGFGLNYNPTYEQAGAIGRAFKIGVHWQY